MRTIVLMLISLATVMFASSLSAQQDCATTGILPVGLANQGGYAFNYQSGKGTECRLYRLRNNPGKVLTPARWKDVKETFIDVNLPECPANSTCPWVEAVKISTLATMIDKTTLSYGANKDEYRDEPDAYRKRVEEATGFPPLITIIRGMVADASKKPLEIAVSVASYAEGMKSPYLLTYIIRLVGESGPFQILRPGDFPKDTLAQGLIWEAAASRAFFSDLERRKIRQLSLKEDKEIIVKIEVDGVEVEESKLLILVQGTTQLAATTAPAYRPRE